jgi:hypothetical protein
MQLVMQRSRLTGVRGYSFSIVARLLVSEDQQRLLSRYNLHNTILMEGDHIRDMKKAAWYTIPAGIVMTFIVAGYYYDVTTLAIGFAMTLGASYYMYQQLREEVRVTDLLTGREFKARSFIGLLEKEHTIRRMADVFEHILRQAETWHEPEVIDLAPQPHFRLVESERAAS